MELLHESQFSDLHACRPQCLRHLDSQLVGDRDLATPTQPHHLSVVLAARGVLVHFVAVVDEVVLVVVRLEEGQSDCAVATELQIEQSRFLIEEKNALEAVTAAVPKEKSQFKYVFRYFSGIFTLYSYLVYVQLSDTYSVLSV